MAKILKILKHPSTVLRRMSEPISEEAVANGDFAGLGADLEETMVKKDGVGLAAPQIGKNIRLIAVSTKNGPILLFNPLIVKKSWIKEWGEEGCLSVPLVFGDVRRHKRVVCAFCNRQGQKEQLKASGLLARVIQHEIDHLDGVLFIDKAKNLKKIDEMELEN